MFLYPFNRNATEPVGLLFPFKTYFHSKPHFISLSQLHGHLFRKFISRCLLEQVKNPTSRPTSGWSNNIRSLGFNALFCLLRVVICGTMVISRDLKSARANVLVSLATVVELAS